MTLQKIAETLETSLSFNQLYKRETGDKQWLEEILHSAYDGMCGKIKHISNGKEYLTYKDAATILDKCVLTVVLVYDEYLKELERNLSNATP